MPRQRLGRRCTSETLIATRTRQEGASRICKEDYQWEQAKTIDSPFTMDMKNRVQGATRITACILHTSDGHLVANITLDARMGFLPSRWRPLLLCMLLWSCPSGCPSTTLACVLSRGVWCAHRCIDRFSARCRCCCGGCDLVLTRPCQQGTCFR